MSKQVLSEGVMDEIIAAIFKAVGRGKVTPTMKQLMKDPEYRRIHAELEERRADLKQFMDKVNAKMETPPGIRSAFTSKK